MLLELIDDSPLYGKKGTIVNGNILNIIPSKHHSLFKEHVPNKQSIKIDWTDIEMMHHKIQRIIENARNNPIVPDEAYNGIPVNGDDFDIQDDPIPYNRDNDNDEEQNENIVPF